MGRRNGVSLQLRLYPLTVNCFRDIL